MVVGDQLICHGHCRLAALVRGEAEARCWAVLLN